MKLVFFGTPEFAVPTLQRLVASPHEVVLVVSRPDRPVGRKQILTPPPIVELAKHLGLPVKQPRRLKSATFAEELAGLGAGAGVVVAYGKLIPARLLTVFPHGFINVHPSLLPRYRGPSPIQWALVHGDTVTGVTTMLLDEGMDTGPILLQREVAIEPRETAKELSSRLASLGADLLVETVDRLEEGRLTPRPQPVEGASVTPMLRRQFGAIDWSMTARQLVNRLRGLTPWPGLYTTFRGGRLKIHSLEEVVDPPGGSERPGTVLATGARGIVVRCGRGTAVRVTDLQREGKRRMPADAFLIGERVVVGERLG